jgi:predicted rRNA methylase YqxC with S4 and FtsJ domains
VVKWLESQEGEAPFIFRCRCRKKNKERSRKRTEFKNMKRKLPKIKKKLKMLIADDDIISRKLILKSVHEFAKEIIEAKQGVKQLKNSKRTQMLI